jgi:hypothetical protein
MNIVIALLVALWWSFGPGTQRVTVSQELARRIAPGDFDDKED